MTSRVIAGLGPAVPIADLRLCNFILQIPPRIVFLGDHVCDADVQGAARAAGENVNIELLHALSFAIGMARTSPAMTPVGV
jgi:hypothetical protein